MEDFLKLHYKGKFCAIKKDLVVGVLPCGDSTQIIISDVFCGGGSNLNETVYVDETPEEVWDMLNPDEEFVIVKDEN